MTGLLNAAVRALALAAFLLLVWSLFRLAMGLRWSKLSRLETRRAEEARGRSVVAELPRPDGTLDLFLEDGAAFYWGDRVAAKQSLSGARLMLNGGILASAAGAGVILPEPAPPEEFEGRERWEVLLYHRDGRLDVVGCGTLREGVSREIAGRVFAAVRKAIGE